MKVRNVQLMSVEEKERKKTEKNFLNSDRLSRNNATDFLSLTDRVIDSFTGRLLPRHFSPAPTAAVILVAVGRRIRQ